MIYIYHVSRRRYLKHQQYHQLLRLLYVCAAHAAHVYFLKVCAKQLSMLSPTCYHIHTEENCTAALDLFCVLYRCVEVVAEMETKIRIRRLASLGFHFLKNSSVCLFPAFPVMYHIYLALSASTDSLPSLCRSSRTTVVGNYEIMNQTAEQ